MRAHASASFCMPGALRMRTPPPRPRRDTRLALLNVSNATSWKAEALLRNLGIPQGPRSSLKELVRQSGRPVWVSHLQGGAKSCFPEPSPRFSFHSEAWSGRGVGMGCSLAWPRAPQISYLRGKSPETCPLHCQ